MGNTADLLTRGDFTYSTHPKYPSRYLVTLTAYLTVMRYRCRYFGTCLPLSFHLELEFLASFITFLPTFDSPNDHQMPPHLPVCPRTRCAVGLLRGRRTRLAWAPVFIPNQRRSLAEGNGAKQRCAAEEYNTAQQPSWNQRRSRR